MHGAGVNKSNKGLGNSKDNGANAQGLGVRRAQGQIIMVKDACNIGGVGTLIQWHTLEKEFEAAVSQWSTEGLNRGRTLKHS